MMNFLTRGRILPMTLRRSISLLVLLLAACGSAAPPAPAATSTNTPEPSLTASLSPKPSLTPTLTPTLATGVPTNTSTATATPLPAALNLDPADWKNWPILPVVPEYARLIYQMGQKLGNDPHAFSVFGDCQSEPDVFMGVYETDAFAIASLPANLQETAAWFTGSFNRLSPTVKGGTTTGALLWSAWHQNKFTCTVYESPVACELRIHKPAFVIIHVGTHYENRNAVYMRTILDQLISAGVVPILATKADNRELDDRVNTAYAKLAVEYNIPFWNFWAAVDDLPNRGLYTRPDAVYQGNLYLIPEAADIHRLSALQALDVVRRAVSAP
jgi:hypothetical protein